MGSGCLSPQTVSGDLTLQLIEEIHKKQPAIARESPYLVSHTTYDKLKQKIYKKSSLRKLIDHLSTHRHKITEALSHNFRVCHQGGTQQTWMIGLAILQRIIDMADSQNVPQKTQKVQNVLKAKRQNEGSQSQQKQTELKTLRTLAGQKQKLTKGVKNSTVSSDFIKKQILSTRFESLVFGIIHSCLQNENLYTQSLRVLSTYTKISTDCFQADDKILQILNLLQDNINDNFQQTVTLQSYMTLVSKMKDKSLLPLINNLRYFIQSWLSHKISLHSAKSLKIINRTQLSINYIELVIDRYFTSSLNSMQYKKPILILMQLHDEQKFQLPLEFEQFYINILRSNDLGSHFLKRLFLQFLHYGVLGSVQSLTGRQKQLALVIGSINLEAKYHNHSDKQTKQNLFKLIKRWLITKNYIKLEQIIKYHCDLFLYCFIINIHLQRSQSSSQTQHIFNDIIEVISNQQKIVLIQTIFQQYQKQKTPECLRKLLLNMSSSIITPITAISLANNISRFSIDISQLNQQETLQLYRALMNLYSKFQYETILLYLHPICELLISICGTLESQNTEIKSKLVTQTVHLCQIIISAQEMILAFYQKILKIIHRKQQKQQPFAQFYLLKSGLVSLFQKYSIQSYLHSPQSSQNLQTEAFNYNTHNDYFNSLNTYAISSKISLKQSGFRKAVSSVIRDTSDMQYEETSFKDIMEMISPE